MKRVEIQLRSGVLLLIVTLVFNAGCGGKQTSDDPAKTQLALEYLGVDTFEFDTIFAPPAYFCGSFMVRGEEYLGIVDNRYGNSLTLVSFADRGKRLRIDCSSLGIGRIKTFDVDDSLVYVYSRDQLSEDSSLVHVLDLDGRYVRKINYLDSYPFFTRYGDTIDQMRLLTYHNSPLQIRKSKAFVAVNHSTKLRTESVIAGYLDLKSDSFVPLPIRESKEYLSVPQGGNVHYFLSQMMVVGDTCYVGFAGSGDLYACELDNGRIHHAVGESKNLMGLSKPPSNMLKDSTFGDTNFLIRKFGSYGKLVFVKGKDLIARLAFLPDENSRDFENERKATIMVFDRNLNLLMESEVLEGLVEGGLFSREDGTLYVPNMSAATQYPGKSHLIVFHKYRLQQHQREAL